MKKLFLLSAIFGAVVANAQNVIIGAVVNDCKVEANDLTTNQNINKSSSAAGVAVPLVYTVVEQMPAFPGSDAALMKYVAKQIKYPALAQEYDVTGVVV